ncbi:methyltransferase [Singulisphaera sp. Ch08]|uniref:Methyltransferase n=1 Tax=Singulisphaera sp. Ch08 TaxID=3120278 RepID=A0AAU7CNX6_9BACT
MKKLVILATVLTAAAGISSSGPWQEVAVAEGKIDKTVEQEPKRKVHPMHGNHKHAFTDPAESAKKWNDPERDKWQRPEEIVAALALKPGATVADIGAGTGYMVAPLSKAVGKGGTVIAIDSSASMVEYLKKQSADLGPAVIVPRKVGPDDPELQAAGVDAVLTLDTWHHVKGREAYARKVYEGLKRGGRFVVVDYEVGAETGPPKEMRLAAGRIVEQLEAGGFRAAVVRESMSRHYMVVGHKD